MKNALFFALILTITACKTSSKAHKKGTLGTDVSMEIQEFMTDSISIRALDYGNANYWYAGSDGKYGKINTRTDKLEKFQLTSSDAIKMEYRSIAVTENFTYLLSAGNPALIYKITHATDEVNLVYTQLGEGVFYDSMKFWNDQEGIAFGDPLEGCFSIIKTIDGGATWTKSKCAELPKFIEGEAAFAASNSNISIYKDNVWIVTGGAAARVLHSKDRGNTWESYPTPIIAGGEMTGIYAVDFENDKNGVLIGGDWNNKENNLTNKAITFDAGMNWRLMDAANGPGYCSDIIFIPETEGKEILAVGSQGIWWSGTKGISWKKLTDQGFYTVKMINSKEGVLAGRHNVSKFTLIRFN